MKEWEEKLQQQKAQYEVPFVCLACCFHLALSSLKAGSERHLKLDLTLVLGCVSSEQLLWQRASQVRGEVDRLLNDKTELTRRCELFSDELKAVERKYQMKIEEMEDHAAKELAKNKQNWIATERLKREAWEKDKVKEIKDMTVKGLQPEVERILAERKQEKVRLEEQKTEALEEQRRELLSLAQQQLQELREQKHREMEAALDREREAHRQKVRDEFERFSRELQEERTKCAADLLAERRLREELIRQAAEGSEVKLREALAAERARLQSSLNEAGERLAEANRQHQDQLSQLEARLRAEAEGSHKAQKEKARLETEEREASLRKELAAERDRQLEVVMDRLSREHVERQLAMETEANRKLQEARAAAGRAGRGRPSSVARIAFLFPESAGEETARVAKQLEEARAEAGVKRKIAPRTLVHRENRGEASSAAEEAAGGNALQHEGRLSSGRSLSVKAHSLQKGLSDGLRRALCRMPAEMRKAQGRRRRSEWTAVSDLCLAQAWTWNATAMSFGRLQMRHLFTKTTC